MATRPNVLLIMSDQHNARCLSIAGHPDVKTPNVDSLAERGVRFESAFVQNPICTPSRMCYLTGLYAHNHGYYGLMGPSPANLPSMFSHFRDHGYHTGAVGKIHTPYGWVESHCDFLRDAYGAGGKNSHFEDYLLAIGLAEDRDDDVLQEWAASGRGGQGLDARCSRLPYRHCVEGWTAAQAQRFLRERPKEKPFLLWVSPPRPHETYAPSEPFWSMYDEDSLTLPPSANDDLFDKPPHIRAMTAQRNDNAPLWIFEPRNWEQGRRRVLRGYLGCVSQVDHCVGEVLKTLDEGGLRENTIVIYCADHGDFAGEHGIIEKAPGVSYGAITRTPFIWSWPEQIAKGIVCDELVESVDVFPTLCALTGIPPMDMCDGFDISSLLQGGNEPLRDAAFTENPLTKCIHTKDWKLVHFPRQMYPDQEADIGELYHLAEDPWERDNLYGRPEHTDRATALRRSLLDWLAASQHPVTILPPISDSNLPEDGRLSPRKVLAQSASGKRNYL